MEISALTAGLILPAPVLLVEDDPLVRRRLESLLRQFGYHADDLVIAASLGEARAALDKARTLPGNPPMALALIDLGLPDGSGIDLIRELHATNPALPILVVSAWSTQDSILASLRAGAIGYVLKEREDLEVMMALRSVLRGGAPIDPFVARRIIEELPPASARGKAKFCNWSHQGLPTAILPNGCTGRAIQWKRTSRTFTASWRLPPARRPRWPRGNAG